jgi:hypothetical protein
VASGARSGSSASDPRFPLWASGRLQLIDREPFELDPALDEAQVTVAMNRIDQIWDLPAEQRIVRLPVREGNRLAEPHRGAAAADPHRGPGP